MRHLGIVRHPVESSCRSSNEPEHSVTAAGRQLQGWQQI
jgi:hypothetical protein